MENGQLWCALYKYHLSLQQRGRYSLELLRDSNTQRNVFQTFALARDPALSWFLLSAMSISRIGARGFSY